MERFGELCGELWEDFFELCGELWEDLVNYSVSCGKIWRTMR